MFVPTHLFSKFTKHICEKCFQSNLIERVSVVGIVQSIGRIDWTVQFKNCSVWFCHICYITNISDVNWNSSLETRLVFSYLTESSWTLLTGVSSSMYSKGVYNYIPVHVPVTKVICKQLFINCIFWFLTLAVIMRLSLLFCFIIIFKL